jgi:R3H domain
VPVVEEPLPKRRRKEREESGVPGARKTIRIYPYGVSKDRLMRAINDLQVSATIAKTPKDADVVLTLKAHEKRQPRTVKELEDQGLELAIIRSNTVSQMKAFLMGAFGLENQKDEEQSALNEVTEAVDKVMSFGKPVELAPQSAHIRRLQHQMIEQHGLGSESRGEVPWRRVIVLPTRG